MHERLDLHCLGRLACVSCALEPSLEAALRVRAVEGGHWLPETLPPGEGAWLRLLLSRERRRLYPTSPVSAGSWHTLFVDETGRLYSTGVERVEGPDRRGLLGHGALQQPEAGLPSPTPIRSMLGVTIRSVAAGNKHSLAISSSGQLFTWGRGADGQCGHGDQVRRCQPTLVRRLADIPIAAAAAGGYHSICAAADGSVYTFGSGARGRIGHGDEADRHVPKLVEALRECSVVAVSAGYKHSLALTDSGAVYSWGKGKHGRLGQGDTVNRLSPMRVEAFRGETVVCIAAGGHHSCAALRNGQVYSWGLDDNGQLVGGDDNGQLGGGGGGGETRREGGGSSQHEDSGQHSGQQPAPGGLAPLHFPPGGVGPRQTRYVPSPVKGLEGVRVRALSAGSAHTLAISEEGRLYAWGLCSAGRLGTGMGPWFDTGSTDVPHEVIVGAAERRLDRRGRDSGGEWR
eukprot:CAMPEP_0185341590 /NCGR_PEP_ID=MMETSP1363-20130426/98702_1 /TAXON_ID=38817 /ORGANISM="Gephyrocapsa oceanica, Strain RCC1303" /LENGTH=457 /DNA_ID=CAMNT_0027940817 /DNA_START=717 /DNA_END=2087 /DNA_ORIENTATION=-